MSSIRDAAPLELAVTHGFNLAGHSFLTIPHSVTFELRGVVLCLQASNSAPPQPVRASILACALRIFSYVTPTVSRFPDRTVETLHRVEFCFPQKRTRQLIKVVAMLRELVDQGEDTVVDPKVAKRAIKFLECMSVAIEDGIRTSSDSRGAAAGTPGEIATKESKV